MSAIRAPESVKLAPPFMILTAVLVLSNFFIFGLLTLLRPSFAFPDPGDSAAFPIQFFAIRHIAFAIPLLHGLLKRNISVLTAMYTIFLIMSVLDVALLLVNGYYIPIIGPIIGDIPVWATVALATGAFIAPMALALRYLRGLEPAGAAAPA